MKEIRFDWRAIRYWQAQPVIYTFVDSGGRVHRFNAEEFARLSEHVSVG